MKGRVEFDDDCRQSAPSNALACFADFVFQRFQAGRRDPQFLGLVRDQAVKDGLARRQHLGEAAGLGEPCRSLYHSFDPDC